MISDLMDGLRTMTAKKLDMTFGEYIATVHGGGEISNQNLTIF